MEKGHTKKVILRRAANLDIECAIFAPGDGMIRYRFHREPGKDYKSVSGILYTAHGACDAWTWLQGYQAGKDGVIMLTPYTLSRLRDAINGVLDKAKGEGDNPYLLHGEELKRAITARMKG